jgi:thymidylate kinase (EC 2.7.4.9)
VFVTIEGSEGAGKSSLASGLARELVARGRAVLVTREPGSGEFGARVRALLLEGDRLEPWAEAFLFLADRAQHIARVVRPALARGEVVVCDRHADSTVVYQGYARGLDADRLRDLNALATGGLVPDHTLLLDLPVELGLARLTAPDRLDREPLAFHRRVRDGFLAEAAREPGRWAVLDATRPAPEVLRAALAVLLGGEAGS